MPVYVACPDLDSWERFLRGQLPADEAETLEAHLAGCAGCGERLGTLEAGDTLAEALRLRPGEAADESDLAEVEALVQRVQQARSVSDDGEADGDHSTPPSSADDGCDFLEPPQTPDELGRFGPYRVLRVLGAGGMGLVFEAEELKLKRRVAIKVMKPSRARHELERQRFLREAQAMAAIEHPHIVTIFHVGEVRETPFLAMQLLKGESLEARLRRMAKGGSQLLANLAPEHDEPGAAAHGDSHAADSRVGSPGLMPVSESLRIGHEIAAALAEAHERGLIHRDIKPSNVWLEAPRGFVKLVDFGLAHVADDVHLTRSGMVLGTPAYMSPEQARGDAVDGRSDLFSLGCVLYKLLTGGVPFQGSSTFAVLSALAIQEPKSPVDLEPSVPAAVSDLVMRLLAKCPEDRFESARAVAEAIATLEQGIREEEARTQVAPCPTAVPTATPPEGHLQTSNSRNRRRLLIATAAAAVVLLAGVVVTVKDKNGKTLLRRLFSDGASVTVARNENDAPPEVLPPHKIERDGGVMEPTASTDPDRRAAEWVLSIGGTLCLPHSTEYKSVVSLPKGPLRLIMVSLGPPHRGQATDAGLANLKDCKYLTYLALNNTFVSDAGLTNLKDCKDLTQLYLRNTQVSDAGLADLARLPRLASLELRDTRISLRGHEQLTAAMPKCQITWSETNRAVAESVLALGGAVDIGTPGQPESRGVEAAADLPREYFQVRSVSLAGVAKPLDKLPEDLSLLRFPEFDRLERLDLSGIPWLDYDFLAHIHGLRELSLDGSKLSDESLARLPKLPALERLVLDGNEIRGPGLTHLREQPELTDLSLACPTLGDLLAKHLADLKQVKRLSLAGSGLTDNGIKHLAALTSLEALDLRGTATTATGVAELRAALPMCRIEWGKAGLPASEPRPSSTNPDRRAAEWVLSIGGTLWLEGRSTQYKSAASLPKGPLRLSVVNLGDRGQATDAGLANLKDCKYLTLLSLHNTLVSDAGLPNLKDCKDLTQLYLQNTQVSDAGVADLARLPRLASLAIRNTRISLRGHEQLRAAMPSCQIHWSETNRAVAESALALGGSVDIGTPGQPESHGVVAAADLPHENFQVRSVSLAGVAKPLGKLPEDLSWLRFPEFDRLERLDLSGIPWLNYDFLAHIHGLRELSLAGSKLSDESLAKLPKLPALERLVLDGNEIRGPGLTHLREQPELTDLSLACPTLGDLLAKHLADLKQVKRLSLAGSGLTDLGIKHLAALTSLEALDLRDTATTAAGVAELRAALPMCRIEWGKAGLPASEPRSASTDRDRRAAEWVLSIGGTLCLPNSTQYRSVASLPKGRLRLTVVFLHDCGQATDAGLANLKDCKYLTYLTLSNTLVSDAGLTNLKDFKDLTQLYLRNTQVSDAGLADLASLPRLASLELRNTRISLRGHEQLMAAMPNCQIHWSETNRAVAESVLALGGAVDIGTPGQPESCGVEAAADLPREYFQVRSVSLAGAAKPLGKLPEELSWLRFPEFDRLERLDLSGVPRLNYDFLAHIHGLRELSLAGSKLSDESLARLPKLPALERLVLDGNEIRGPGLTHLREQPELTDLSLACPTLGDLLAKHLADLKQVKRLSLSGSGLTDLGIKHLAALTSLEALDLRDTATTAAGVAELRAALPMCRIEWGKADEPASEPRR